MAAQHKRSGRKGRQERIQRAQEQKLAKFIRLKTVVQIPNGRKRYDGFPGRIVAIGIPPEMEGIA